MGDFAEEWTSRDRNASSGGWNAGAQDGARRSRLFTQRELPVVPVLLAWGSNTERMPHGRTGVDGVMVVLGSQMRPWRELGRAADGPPDAGVVDAISACMARYEAARVRSASKVSGVQGLPLSGPGEKVTVCRPLGRGA